MDNNRPTLTFVTDHLGELLQDHLNSGMKELNARVLVMARLKDFKPVLPAEEYHGLYRKLIEGQPPFTRNRITQYIPDSTRWLTRKLRLNPTALFADFRDECMTSSDQWRHLQVQNVARRPQPCRLGTRPRLASQERKKFRNG